VSKTFFLKARLMTSPTTVDRQGAGSKFLPSCYYDSPQILPDALNISLHQRSCGLPRIGDVDR